MVVFLLPVLLQSLQVVLAKGLFFHQEVEHVGGVERLLTDRFGRQVQGENIVQIVVIGLRGAMTMKTRQRGGERNGGNSLSEDSVPPPLISFRQLRLENFISLHNTRFGRISRVEKCQKCS